MKYYVIIILLFCVGLCSCRKNYLQGIRTSVSGRFYDNSNQEAYPNLTVRVAEYETFNTSFFSSGQTFLDYVDSTQTDINGNYSISFSTSGNGSSYFLEVKYPSNVAIGINGSNYRNPHEYSQPIANIGGANTYNFDVFKQYYMQTRIKVINNPYPPMYIYVNGGQFLNTGLTPDYLIKGTNNDTVVNLLIRKNSNGFYVGFNIFNPATNIYYNDTSHSTLNPLINKDTIQGGTYTLYPSTFK